MCNIIGHMVIFGRPFFYLFRPFGHKFGHPVLYFLAIWIRPTVPVCLDLYLEEFPAAIVSDLLWLH